MLIGMLVHLVFVIQKDEHVVGVGQAGRQIAHPTPLITILSVNRFQRPRAANFCNLNVVTVAVDRVPTEHDSVGPGIDDAARSAVACYAYPPVRHGPGDRLSQRLARHAERRGGDVCGSKVAVRR